MRRKLHSLARHPLIIIPPLVVVLILGWQQYTFAGRDLSLPSSQNLLPGGDFSEVDAAGVPTGWQLSHSGTSTYLAARGKGYTGSNSFGITVSGYQSGDVALTSPKVTIEPGKTYLFKGYYKATSAPFALLLRSYNVDGSSSLRLVRTYPAADTWSTVSDAFTPPVGTTAVQVVYRVYANGQLQIDSPYLEPAQAVYVPPTPTGANAAPNGSLAAGDYNAPSGWLTYRVGDNSTMFSYHQDTGGNYVQATVSGYRNGQAKWQYAAQSVHANQTYQLSVEYQSDVSVPLVAEYTRADGDRQDETVAQLPPADSWTTATYTFQTVPGATTLFVALPLERDGTVSSRNYSLIDTTRSGAAQWQQPVASITFDDGWQQAYANAVPLLTQYGYKATFYVNPATIETPNFMNASELAALSGAGNEIGTDGYEHSDLTAINSSALEYQLHEGRDYLRSAGFDVSDLAVPYGRSDAEVQWHARAYLTTLRGTEPGINTRQNIDPYNLKVLRVTSQTSPDTIATALQQAKSYHGWLIVSYHQVSDESPSNGPLHAESTVTPASFKQQLAAIHASGIRVLPIATAYQTLEHP